MGLSSPKRENLIVSHSTFQQYISEYICGGKDGLVAIAKDYEAKGQAKDAQKIYRMMISIGEQSKKDVFFIVDEIRIAEYKQKGYEGLKENYTGTEKEKVIKELEELAKRKEHLIDLFVGAYPTFGPKLRELVNQVIEYGEIEAFERKREKK